MKKNVRDCFLWCFQSLHWADSLFEKDETERSVVSLLCNPVSSHYVLLSSFLQLSGTDNHSSYLSVPVQTLITVAFILSLLQTFKVCFSIFL